MPRPDIEGREKILAVHMKKVPLAPDVDPRTIARGTPGFSGADLANLVNEAALLAARKGKRLVAMSEFELAKDKVMMGAERKSMVMTEDEKKATAYHEAGHALVSLHVPGCDPLHKVTIIPRGRALGVTWNLPERDRYSMSMKQMKARLALCFGGRIAEQLIYGSRGTEHRRLQRHPAGDRHGPLDGHGIWHVVEARLAPLPRQSGGGVPRPQRRPQPERLRGDGAADRQRGPPADRGGGGRPPARSSPRISTSSTASPARCSNSRP